MTEALWRKMFAKNLKDKLGEYGWTQKELAIRANISKVTISRYCSGERVPNCYSLSKIADALGCTMDELVRYRRI